MFKKFFFLLGLFFISISLLSQQSTIKGKITDEANNKISFANVLLLKDSAVVMGTVSDESGNYLINKIQKGTYSLVCEYVGYEKFKIENIKINDDTILKIDIKLPIASSELKYEVLIDSDLESLEVVSEYKMVSSDAVTVSGAAGYYYSMSPSNSNYNTESYDRIYENGFLDAMQKPLSTFSADVDNASYSNSRRFINNHSRPPKDAVRIEEFINYFEYDYPQPNDEHPFSINLESGECPWNKEHKLVRVGIKGKDIKKEDLSPSNLVFLIDVSGSMRDENKLPLLKKSMNILIENLDDADRVSIVVYANKSGVILNSVNMSDKNKLKVKQSINQLQAHGSTAGGQGIQTAYRIAKENFIKDGNNRVILATDGDFNVGISDNASLVRYIEKERESGVYLSILGFGMNNYKDAKMEQISNAGNGNYAYIDNILEAKKVFNNQLRATLYTIAKDVKIQVEFNPAYVKAYRLIGYENRLLEDKDFNDDEKDAGEIGAGHTVTAFYEIIPANSDEEVKNADELKYQNSELVKSKDLLTIKFRYKPLDSDKSILISKSIQESDIESKNPSSDFMFATAVIEFGLLLRDSEFKANSNFDALIKRARKHKGKDYYGYRSEFINLAEKAELL